MTPPLERKAKTESILRKQGTPINEHLPCIESERATRLRSGRNVGIRILCLYCVGGTAFDRRDGAKDQGYRAFLKKHKLWNHLTPEELAFVRSRKPTAKRTIKFTWRSEALFLLLWAARRIEELPLPQYECATAQVVEVIQPLLRSPWPEIGKVRLRLKRELLDASDLIYRQHWAVRDALLSGKKVPGWLHPSVVDEWHHAINWLTCYENQEWDEVTTDT